MISFHCCELWSLLKRQHFCLIETTLFSLVTATIASEHFGASTRNHSQPLFRNISAPNSQLQCLTTSNQRQKQKKLPSNSDSVNAVIEVLATRFVDEAKQSIASGSIRDASVDRLKQLPGNIAEKIQDRQAIHAKIMDIFDEEEIKKVHRGTRQRHRLSSSSFERSWQGDCQSWTTHWLTISTTSNIKLLSSTKRSNQTAQIGSTFIHWILSQPGHHSETCLRRLFMPMVLSAMLKIWVISRRPWAMNRPDLSQQC